MVSTRLRCHGSYLWLGLVGDASQSDTIEHWRQTAILTPAIGRKGGSETRVPPYKDYRHKA